MAEERKIKEIREEYASCGEDMLPSFIEEYLADGRPGVSKLIGQAQRRLEKLRLERARTEKLKEYEHRYGGQYHRICGIDEVGEVPWRDRWWLRLSFCRKTATSSISTIPRN